ncbi:ribulose-phosphate 3-epimerase [Rubripirellula amarantea]|uniref:Ribulose-phosphate 3-epimerase n=1 Tax=Rubripirellula amarantea TaxID=2527999 RepID=A0A5C5WVI4_9BACT|nr:ribulose-phosphate 3-epimerase [Rubripirellula amarantea]MDA8745602.1 ribulose-phosphate 3-epimerase [Rubripirellula amarantea]TWT54141.1 Ribulose-phosphate 3-epimerase [Rubripirellula amarantea]
MSRASLEAIRSATPAVLPSLLLCDFGDLKGEVARLADAGTKVLHLDVMDGHFVPNMTYAMPIVEGLRRHTDMPLDVHLMISDPLAYAKAMVDAGADMLTFHVEAVKDAAAVAQEISDLGVNVGIALNPETPLALLRESLPHVDMVLVMSVEAGFGGQKFNPVALEKLQVLRKEFPDLLLQIDGGIDTSTIGPAREAGCDLFVVGSAIFKKDDYKAAIAELDDAIAKAEGTAS